MRNSVHAFLENQYIYRLILIMTIILCVVILLELSFDDSTLNTEILNAAGVKIGSKRNLLGNCFYVINYFLMAFFIVEIVLKVFSQGALFFEEFISVFDAIIVIISFVFMVQDSQVKSVGVLRILRLAKIITEMRRMSLIQKELQEQIKQKTKSSS